MSKEGQHSGQFKSPSFFMKSTKVYDDFSSNARYIRSKLKEQLATSSNDLRPLMEYYLSDRLQIFSTKNDHFDPQYGIPVPYLVYWFAEAFQYYDVSIVDQLALSLMYATAFCCIRDDLVDGRPTIGHINSNYSDHAYVALANLFMSKFLKIFRSMFPKKSVFWYYLVNSLDYWWNHEYWSRMFLLAGNKNYPSGYFMSRGFLSQASGYMVGMALPPLSALAIKAKQKNGEFKHIKNFLVNYAMGYKIVDDLRDWKQDLKEDCPQSTVINHAPAFISVLGNKMTEREINAAFYNQEFTKSVYRTILKFYSRAMKEIMRYPSALYLKQYMGDQIEYFNREEQYLLAHQEKFRSSILDFSIELGSSLSTRQ